MLYPHASLEFSTDTVKIYGFLQRFVNETDGMKPRPATNGATKPGNSRKTTFDPILRRLAV